MTITKRIPKGTALTHLELDANFTDLERRMGWSDYNDSATAGSPIALTVADTFYTLTNDGLGPFSQSGYKIPQHDELWDVNTDSFDFSSLTLGDTVELRIDVLVTTTGPTREITMRVAVAQGSPGPYTLQVDQRSFKNAGTHQIVALATGYVGDVNTQNFPMNIEVASDGVGTNVVVNGWFVKTHTR
jgi:hypothetical protein